MRTPSIRSLFRSSALSLGLTLGLSACGTDDVSANTPFCFADTSAAQGVSCFTEPWDMETTLLMLDSARAQVIIRDGKVIFPDGTTPWDVAPAVVIRDRDNRVVSPDGKTPWDRVAQGKTPWDRTAQGTTPWDRTAQSDDEVKPAVIIRDVSPAVVIRDLAVSYPSLSLECSAVSQGLTFCRAE
jgi:hypothetical protein